jgi:lipopolysaccharide biosynthesis glycosyltransferase
MVCQGFNTGVVLYRLDRMRKNELYNSYLTSTKVKELVDK